MRIPHALLVSSAAIVSIFASSGAVAGVTFDWVTVVNNNDLFPDDSRHFNSYNQPSINNAGLVVFRARTQGGGGGQQPATGILTRDMSRSGNPIVPVAVRGSIVPQPNNLGATFNEFPAFPRIDAGSSMIATRGQSQPVLEYQVGVDPVTGEAVTTRAGTAGIYANPAGSLITGASGLGNVNNSVFPSNPDLSYFQVPGATPGTKFDQFPGAPSPTSSNMIAFKGNWTSAAGSETGVYYRSLTADGGRAQVQLVADSQTPIPGFSGTTFGSTAPPSAAGRNLVFVGLDNEAAPTMGGIYVAKMNSSNNAKSTSLLSTIVSIGQAVVDKANAFITQLGESLSFDGRHVAYWGAWGSKDASGNLVTPMHAVNVSCGAIENANVSSFCLSQDNGITLGSGTAGDGIFTFNVPDNQGFFITDVNNLKTELVAETGSTFGDFLYWNFSGNVPGVTGGDDEGELARWRSASFIASTNWDAAFKASLTSGDTGLYSFSGSAISTIAQIGMDGGILDPAAAGLPISSLGLERDGYRNGMLAINAGMTDGVSSMAGIYVGKATHGKNKQANNARLMSFSVANSVPEPTSWALMIAGMALVGSMMRLRKQQKASVRFAF